MRFGNTFAMFRRGLLFLVLLGLVVDAVVIFLAVYLHTVAAANWPVLVILPLGFPMLLSLALGPTLLFSIHVVDGRVRHMLLDRYVLSDLPAPDFEDLRLNSGRRYMDRLIAERSGFTSADFEHRPNGLWAATLYFKHGRKIRLFGMHMRIMRSLKDALISAREGHPIATT